MCLVTKKMYAKIAEKDITAYKEVLDFIDVWKPFYVTGVLGEKYYSYNKILTAENQMQQPIKNLYFDVFNRGEKLYSINSGFHAFTDKITLSSKSRKKIVIIPSGSQYCIDISGYQIVATKMIVFNSRISYIKYKLRKLFKRD